MSHDRTSAPFVHADGRLRTTLGTIGVIITLTAAGVAAWASARNDITTTARDVEAQGTEMRAHDARIRKLEEGQADIRVMKNDVDWIRRTLERQERARGN